MTDAITSPAARPPPAPDDDGDDGAPEAPGPAPAAGQRWLGWRAATVGPWVAIAAVTVVSVALRLLSPLWLVHAPNDDGLFARLAGSLVDGEWLGSYDQLTLIKGPGYPLFMAMVYKLHLPLKLTEHGVHLLACAVMGLAVWRVFRSRAAGMAAYAALALNPAYLGATAARVSRDTFYGSLCLLLVGGIVLLLASVPALASRGLRWAVPVLAVAGPALGVVAAGYYLCREERSWLAPTIVLAGVACVAGWPRRERFTLRNGLVVAGAAVVAGTTAAAGLAWTAEQNREAYGTSVLADLADGEIARAYGEWQRVEAGPRRLYVPVTAEQREAVFEVSPAAAEMAGAFGGEATGWVGLSCEFVGVCDDYMGAFFVWAMRDAGLVSGHGDSGGESQRYFARVADDIARACDTGELRCTDPPIGPLPPLSLVSERRLASSTREIAESFLAYDIGEPERPPSGAPAAAWDTLTHPIRGAGDEADHVAAEARLLRHQEAVSGLTDLYRWGVRLGVVVGLAGVVLGVVTRAGRRRAAALLFVATMLVTVLVRIVLLALIDATAWPAAGQLNYILPATDFLVLFVLLGCWLLATVVRERRVSPAAAAP